MYVDGHPVITSTRSSVAAALMAANKLATRQSVGGEARFAVCGMGICQECRVTIDGRPHQLACQTRCVNGMQIQSVEGAR